MKEQQAEKKKTKSNVLTQYVENGSYNNQVFNHLVVIWLLRNSLPWMRIKDMMLSICVWYARRGIKLYTRCGVPFTFQMPRSFT
jgi:hypothetical protein